MARSGQDVFKPPEPVATKAENRAYRRGSLWPALAPFPSVLKCFELPQDQPSNAAYPALFVDGTAGAALCGHRQLA